MVVVMVSTWKKLTLDLKTYEPICLPAPRKGPVPVAELRLGPYANLQNSTAVNYGIQSGQFSHSKLKLL